MKHTGELSNKTKQRNQTSNIKGLVGCVMLNHVTNSNNAILYVANSSANALLASSRVQLARSQSIVLNIDNLDDIWLNANNNGVTATLVVEA